LTTSVTTSLPLWLAGCTYDGNAGTDLRNSMVTAMFYDVGIVAGGSGTQIGVLGGVIGGAGLVINAGSGMSVLVQPGSFVVPVTSNPTAGGYCSTLASQATLTVATADPSNPRIDVVAAYVNDTGTSGSSGAVEIITGTAAPTPTAPAAPANSIVLAQVLVPAGSSSVSQGNITDSRPFTTATGGILVAPKGTVTGYVGQLAYDKPSGSFYHNTNGGSFAMQVLPWQAQVAVRNSDYVVPSGTSTMLSAGITTDGRTDIKITYHICGVYQATPTTGQVIFNVAIDGTQLDEIDLMTHATDSAGISHSGFTSVYSTSSAAGDTPAAGAHTVTFNTVTTETVSVRAAATRLAYLRVEPVSK
jgi:hypothetical protein